jgi:cell division septum initiation protein DivIVA
MDDHTDLIPLRPEEEAVPAFELERRGYNRQQVDEHVAWLEDRLREAETMRATAETSARQAETDATRAREELEAGRPDWSEFGERIASILALAEQEAAEIRKRGETEREQLSADARRMAEDAERAHARRMQEADRDAQNMLREAQAESERVVREAQQVALREERDSKRRLLDLERQRDAVHRQLLKLQEGLNAAMAPLGMVAQQQPEASRQDADDEQQEIDLEDPTHYQRA